MTNFKAFIYTSIVFFLLKTFMEPGISVVICCYNSEQKIQKALTCLQDQKFEKELSWEVLVVDNASTDRTATVAKDSWKLKGVSLSVVNEPNPGISHARRRGFDEARFEIISFVDDDNWVEKDWIQKVFETMYADREIGILGGNGTAVADVPLPAWFNKYQSAYAVGPQGDASGERKSILYGAGMNIRKSTWENLKKEGFDFQLTGRKGKVLSSGEDSELSLAVILNGQKLYYRSDLTFDHFMPEGRLNWDYLMKLVGSFGRAEPVTGIYHSLVRGYSGFEAKKYQNRFFSLLRSVFDNFKFLPKHIRLIFSKKDGFRDQYKSVYLWNSLKTKIQLYRKFPSIVAEIRDAGWNKLTP